MEAKSSNFMFVAQASAGEQERWPLLTSEAGVAACLHYWPEY
jgi:hypothetical protein